MGNNLLIWGNGGDKFYVNRNTLYVDYLSTLDEEKVENDFVKYLFSLKNVTDLWTDVEFQLEKITELIQKLDIIHSIVYNNGGNLNLATSLEVEYINELKMNHYLTNIIGLIVDDNTVKINDYLQSINFNFDLLIRKLENDKDNFVTNFITYLIEEEKKNFVSNKLNKISFDQVVNFNYTSFPVKNVRVYHPHGRIKDNNFVFGISSSLGSLITLNKNRQILEKVKHENKTMTRNVSIKWNLITIIGWSANKLDLGRNATLNVKFINPNKDTEIRIFQGTKKSDLLKTQEYLTSLGFKNFRFYDWDENEEMKVINLEGLK